MRFDKISDQLLYIFFQITFCVNIWFVLKQLDNEPEGGGGGGGIKKEVFYF